MTLPIPDHQRVVEATRVAGDRFCALLRGDLDPEAPAVGMWSVTDVATHVCVGAELYRALLAGRPSPFVRLDALGQRNQQLVNEFDGDRDLDALADRLEKAAAALFEDVASRSADSEVMWHAGIRLPLPCLTAIALGELTVHGYDIAHANQYPWPIDQDHALLIFAGTLYVLPYFVDRGAGADTHATFEMRLTGTEPMRLRFLRGEPLIYPPDGGRVDCYLAGEPSTFLLASYGRMSPIRPVLTRHIRVWGRKPWLALQLARLVHAP